MSLITNHVNRIKSKPYFLSCLNPFCCNCPCILQVWMNHDHTDNRTQIWISTKHFCTAVCDQDWQECVRRITEKLRKSINRAAGINIQETIVYHEIQRFHDSHKETTCNNSRNDRHKNISKSLNQSLYRICSGSCNFLQILLAALGNSCNLDELIIYFIHNTGSQNDLHLSLCKENAFNAFNVLNIFLVCLRVVTNNQSKTCGTMSCGNNVLFFTDMVIYFLSCLSVIHNILLLIYVIVPTFMYIICFMYIWLFYC